LENSFHQLSVKYAIKHEKGKDERKVMGQYHVSLKRKKNRKEKERERERE